MLLAQSAYLEFVYEIFLVRLLRQDCHVLINANKYFMLLLPAAYVCEPHYLIIPWRLVGIQEYVLKFAYSMLSLTT